MASDPRKLKPSELCRLLNSTPMGEVLSDRQLHRHRMRAGNRIGDGDTPEMHRLFAEHLTAEYRVKTEGRGRSVDEWKSRPERGDNHWLDCLVGCAVAASMQGASLKEISGGVPQKKSRISFAEIQRKRNRYDKG